MWCWWPLEGEGDDEGVSPQGATEVGAEHGVGCGCGCWRSRHSRLTASTRAGDRVHREGVAYILGIPYDSIARAVVYDSYVGWRSVFRTECLSDVSGLRALRLARRGLSCYCGVGTPYSAPSGPEILNPCVDISDSVRPRSASAVFSAQGPTPRVGEFAVRSHGPTGAPVRDR